MPDLEWLSSIDSAEENFVWANSRRVAWTGPARPGPSITSETERMCSRGHEAGPIKEGEHERKRERGAKL